MRQVTVITATHRSRGGLAKKSKLRRAGYDPRACRQCGRKHPLTRFYFAGSGKRIQPCVKCHRDRYGKRGTAAPPKPVRETKPVSPVYSAPGDKRVGCAYPGCEFEGNYLELGRHMRDKHD